MLAALIAGLLLALALAQNVAIHHARAEAYRDWTSIDANNRRLVSEAGPLAVAECAVVGTNTAVRGYLNLLLGRGALEAQRLEDLLRRAEATGACAAVHLQARPVWPDLPRVSRIVVVDASGRRSFE